MKSVASICLLLLCVSALPAQQMMTPAKEAPIHTYTAKDSDVYCAGYISNQPPLQQLYVLAGEEGGLKQAYSDRDTIYLSRGSGSVVNPGGEYIMVRKAIDPVRVDVFEGQTKMMQGLGQVYAEVGRIKVDRVGEYVATATVMRTCGELTAGDIAVPLAARPMPTAPSGTFDRFAPPSGKVEGVIVTGKEYESTLGAGRTIYLNVGANQGVTVGQAFRVIRSYSSAASDPNRRQLENTPTHLGGMRQAYKLNKSQKVVMPRDILGEIVILSVTEKTATALITMSSAEIFPGDGVEAK